MKTYSLTFKDGLMLEGFEWSIFGYYYKTFPDSGWRSEQSNMLKYTREALQDEGIEITAE